MALIRTSCNEVLISTNNYHYTASFSYPGAATGSVLGGVTLSVPVDITFDNTFTNGLSNDIPVLTLVDPTGENQIGFYGVSIAGQIPMRMDVTQDGITSSYQCSFCTTSGCFAAQSWTAEIRNNYANLYYGSTLCGSIQFTTPIKSSGLQGAQLAVTLGKSLTASSNVNIVSPAQTDGPTAEPTVEPTMQPTSMLQHIQHCINHLFSYVLL